jgi:hypothetical protein
MKYALAVALALLGSGASAATPDEAFVAERDAFIAKFNPPGDPVAPTDAASKDMERARTELTKRLRSIIGPVNVKGFSGEGEYSVGSLFKGDMEFGMLDGLVFKRGKETQLVVTTTAVAQSWIKSTDGFLEEGQAAPKDLPSALVLDDFYTRATSSDAAASNMGELPVTRPAGVDFAYAMLAIRRQDTGAGPAEEMLIGAIVPPRLYVLSTPIAKIAMMPPCAKLLKDAEAKADKMVADNEKSKTPNDNVGDEAEKLRDQGDEAMRKCFAERVKSNPEFARLTKQAQDFIDGLATK